MLVDGEIVEGRGEVVAVVNPATEEDIADVRSADSEQVDSAAPSRGAIT
jgi:aminobutyraldehyde dehydrogenase